MLGDEIVKPQPPEKAESADSVDASELKQRALALGLEFSRRAVEAESLDDLFFILTNDIRVLTGFDRALLITHMGGTSGFAAATNQPLLKKQSKLYKEVTGMAGDLSVVHKGILLSATADPLKLSDEELPPVAREKLLSHMKLSGCSFLLCVPLMHNRALLGHLLLEFHEDNVPNEIEIMTTLSVAPFLATALAEKWLLQESPGVFARISPDGTTRGASAKRKKVLTWSGVLLAVILTALYFVPVNYTVGGESEIVPRDRHLAFIKIDGIVKRINVKEGAHVKKDEVIATLDKKELDHQIKTAARRFDILTKEMVLLRRESGEDPSKLAESNLVELKRRSAFEELQYMKWKARFLRIKAPVSGIVVTKEVDSFVGKKFQAGEPFCEIAVPGELLAAIYVPEERISLVKKGQPATVYLNSEPRTAYHLKVVEIAPIAETLPRLGSVYRVRAQFNDAPSHLKVGMKGVGKIHTIDTNLYFIVGQRFMERWNQLSIYF